MSASGAAMKASNSWGLLRSFMNMSCVERRGVTFLGDLKAFDRHTERQATEAKFEGSL